jgi:hypothetical protein
VRAPAAPRRAAGAGMRRWRACARAGGRDPPPPLPPPPFPLQVAGWAGQLKKGSASQATVQKAAGGNWTSVQALAASGSYSANNTASTGERAGRPRTAASPPHAVLQASSHSLSPAPACVQWPCLGPGQGPALAQARGLLQQLGAAAAGGAASPWPPDLHTSRPHAGGLSLVSPPKDQSDCGCAAVLAAAATRRWRVALRRADPRHSVAFVHCGTPPTAPPAPRLPSSRTSAALSPPGPAQRACRGLRRCVRCVRRSCVSFAAIAAAESAVASALKKNAHTYDFSEWHSW